MEVSIKIVQYLIFLIQKPDAQMLFNFTYGGT